MRRRVEDERIQEHGKGWNQEDITATGWTKLERLMGGRLQKWADRQRLEREGDEITESLEKHEEKEKELEEEKRAKEKWEDWQRLEREGNEIVEAMRRHERSEEEKGRREEKAAEKGEMAVEELREVSALAKRRAQKAEENTKAVEAEARMMIAAAREGAAEEMMAVVGEGYGTMRFAGEGITPWEHVNRMREGQDEHDAMMKTTMTEATNAAAAEVERDDKATTNAAAAEQGEKTTTNGDALRRKRKQERSISSVSERTRRQLQQRGRSTRARWKLRFGQRPPVQDDHRDETDTGNPG